VVGTCGSGRLVGDRPSDQGPAGRIAGDLQAFEPARPVTVQDATHVDFVVGRSIDRPRRSRWSAVSPARYGQVQVDGIARRGR
jgi:hypothetical protein